MAGRTAKADDAVRLGAQRLDVGGGRRRHCCELLFTSDLTADRKDQGMRVLRSTAVILALIMMSAPKAAFGQAQSQPAAIAPEHQEMAAKRAKERERKSQQLSEAGHRAKDPAARSRPIRHQLPGWHDRTKSAVRHRAGVPGAGRQKSEGKRKSGRLPATGQRTKSFTPRSAAIRDQLPGQIAAANMTTDKRGAS